MSVESLKCLKVYISKQYKDIETWEDDESGANEARVDELQCLETYLDYLIAKETDTLDEHYDKMFPNETEA